MRASSSPSGASRFAALAPADMVLHAIVHLFYGGEMDDALRDLVDIADLLEKHRIKRVPVVRDGCVVGIEASLETHPRR